MQFAIYARFLVLRIHQVIVKYITVLEDVAKMKSEPRILMTGQIKLMTGQYKMWSVIMTDVVTIVILSPAYKYPIYHCFLIQANQCIMRREYIIKRCWMKQQFVLQCNFHISDIRNVTSIQGTRKQDQ